MTYSMQAPYNMQYPNQPEQKSAAPAVFGMATLGAIGGGAVGYFRNRYPIGKDDKVSDSFAKQVYENIAKLDAEDNKVYKQCNAILKKIDKVKDGAELKKLLEKNKEASEVLFKNLHSSKDAILNMVSKDNIKSTKETIKQSIKSANEMFIQCSKNIIQKCWDKENKTFVKPEKMDSKIFEAVKSTKSSNAWKKALKYGGITAGVLGALTLVYNIMTTPRVR